MREAFIIAEMHTPSQNSPLPFGKLRMRNRSVDGISELAQSESGYSQ